MDRINGLADDLLVKILSFVPTKVAVSTSILSKRWEFLWMWLPKLEYVSSHSALRDFVDKNLPLHRAPVIESLHLQLSDSTKPEDIKRWVGIAVSRYVRELEIGYCSDDKENIFPSSFYTCKSLVILKLEYVTLVDVPSMACLHSLKTLQLHYVKYADEEILQQLLSICPVLEELSVYFRDAPIALVAKYMKEFTISVPSLQSLSLYIPDDWFLDGYEIDTPSLKYFKLEDWNDFRHYSKIKNMPKLREASVDVRYHILENVIGSITSVKRLTLCSEILKTGGENVYGGDFVFNQLENLKLCVCKEESSNLLAQMLKDSPKLQVLDISDMEYHGRDERNKMVCWNQPSAVPECMLTSLQILIWSRYFGRKQDRDIAVYILKNACHLRTATIVADTTQHCVPNLKMIKELTLSSRASSTCELVFVEGHHVLADESATEESSAEESS